MTCKDCLYYELCKYNTYQEAHYFGKDKEIYIMIDNNSPCKFFTARSEWVHLPFKVGDTVWFITGIHHSLIKSARIEEIIINETGIRELYVSTENGCYFQNDINTFYLTREGAEKALEEKK